MTYHYKESGLDNIYLLNGYGRHQTPYGEGITIQDTAGLHKAIGKWLVSLPKSLNGRELRFIRIEMDLTQKKLASLIGTTEQTLRYWEKNRGNAISGSADRLLRALYSEFIGGDGSVRDLVNRLAELNAIEEAEARFTETDQGWQVAA